MSLRMLYAELIGDLIHVVIAISFDSALQLDLNETNIEVNDHAPLYPQQ